MLLMRDSHYVRPIALVSGIVLILGIVFLFNMRQREITPVIPHHTNAEYIIEGQKIRLKDGIAETEAAPGSASKSSTRYFGNDLEIDLNGDGRIDTVFLLTYETGGSGIFYYVVAAINSTNGYIGSDGFLLGDRIAPQTIEKSQNPQHENVIVVNFAERASGEPMTAQPSVGRSVYLKLDPSSGVWSVFETDSVDDEGGVAESWGTLYGAVLLGPTCPVERDPPDPACADRPYATSLVLTTPDGERVIKTFSSDAAGMFSVEVPPGEYAIRAAATANMLPYCQSDGSFIVPGNDSVEVQVSCDTGIR